MEKLQSIKTYILIAWIFTLLALLGLVGYFIVGVIIGTLVSGLTSVYSPVVGAAAFVAIIPGIIIILVFAIPTILVFVHLNKMRQSVDKGEIDKLKRLNSTGWAIVALLFSGLIPGIMLLVAHGPIEELDKVPVAAAPGPAPVPTLDSLDRIGKLKSLLDAGAITKEEFESQKNSILHPGAVQSSQSSPKGLQTVANSTPITQASGSQLSGDALKLERLKGMLDGGLITQQDYDEQKKKILGTI